MIAWGCFYDTLYYSQTTKPYQIDNDSMAISEDIPGMKPGNTGRNVGVAIVYLFLLPLILALSLFIIPILIGINYNGIATKLDSIPGINSAGGVSSGIVSFFVLFALFGLISTIAPVSDEGIESTNGEDLDANSPGTGEATDTPISGTNNERTDTPTPEPELIEKSEEELLLSINQLPSGWDEVESNDWGKNQTGFMKFSGGEGQINSKADTYNSISTAKVEYDERKQQVESSKSTSDIGIADQAVLYKDDFGGQTVTVILFRQQNVVGQIQYYDTSNPSPNSRTKELVQLMIDNF